MIYLKIKRKCGHEEEIGVAGFSGSLLTIPLKYKIEVDKNIQWQKDKLCLPCFNLLPDEEKRELLKEAIENGSSKQERIF